MARKYKKYNIFRSRCLYLSLFPFWRLMFQCYCFVLFLEKKKKYRNNSKSYYPPDAYNQSKLAQVLFTRHLQLLINQDEDCHVQINAVHPGVVDTDLFQYSSLSYISWFKKLFFKVKTF